jgi:hypothetical protein
MTQGGDSRLLPDSTGYSKYGIGLASDADICFSSTTASPVSTEALEVVVGEAYELSRADDVQAWMGAKYENIRADLRAFWPPLESCHMCFFPSGTDAEYLAVTHLLKREEREKIYVVLGADESGSGTRFVTEYLAFDNITPRGLVTSQGFSAGSFAGSLCTFHVGLRESTGVRRSSDQLEEEVLSIAKHARRRRAAFMVRYINCTKTGIRYQPSARLRSELASTPGFAGFVGDFCQGRFQESELRVAVDHSDALIVTGSKFFGGPPFSGLIAVPRDWEISEALEMSSDTILAHFVSAELVPPESRSSSRTSDWSNQGLMLRWLAAQFEMRRFFSIDQHDRQDFTNRAVQVLNTVVEERQTSLQPIIDPEMTGDEASIALIESRSRQLTMQQAKHVYEYLAGRRRRASLTTRNQDLRILIGQPVLLTSMRDRRERAALRVAIGARDIVGLAQGDIETLRVDLERAVLAVDQAFREFGVA